MDKLQSYLAMKSEQNGSWVQFFDWNRFNLPPTIDTVRERFWKNIEIYHLNYTIISISVFLYAIVSSPKFLLTITSLVILSLALIYRNRSIRLWNNKMIDLKHQLLILFVFCSIVSVSIGLTTVLFWLIGLLISMIVLHSILHEPREQSPTNSGTENSQPYCTIAGNNIDVDRFTGDTTKQHVGDGDCFISEKISINIDNSGKLMKESRMKAELTSKSTSMPLLLTTMKMIGSD
ncbi:hypothetical protein SSS_00205 [Sarcoptes scabiei]|uniref:PRA1 family protein n=1 Tax=Sarcoptes scabiei TaxID=52283 RepID=A0A834R4L0_SARSC|nr:hypothetical protein SSS_00205 [Sarcoptes scabiei]